jgi:hypothetical protein
MFVETMKLILNEIFGGDSGELSSDARLYWQLSALVR